MLMVNLIIRFMAILIVAVTVNFNVSLIVNLMVGLMARHGTGGEDATLKVLPFVKLGYILT